MAVYAYRGEGVSLGEKLERLVAQVGIAFQTGAELNVLKFRTDELKVPLLCEGIRASFGAAVVRAWGVIHVRQRLNSQGGRQRNCGDAT